MRDKYTSLRITPPAIEITQVDATESSTRMPPANQRKELLQLQHLLAKLTSKLEEPSNNDNIDDNNSPPSPLFFQPVLSEAVLAGLTPRPSVTSPESPPDIPVAPVLSIPRATGLTQLLASALDKSTNLFNVDAASTVSPRAQSTMSYNLKVNSRYRHHMDEAPLKAEELKRQLLRMMEELEEARVILGEMRGVVKGLVSAEEVRGGKNAMVEEEDESEEERQGLDQKLSGNGEKRQGEASIEERMRKASIKSEAFV